MKTEDLPIGTSRVFEEAASEGEPAAAKARAANTPPIDIIGGRCLTLYSGGTRNVFEGGCVVPPEKRLVSRLDGQPVRRVDPRVFPAAIP